MKHRGSWKILLGGFAAFLLGVLVVVVVLMRYTSEMLARVSLKETALKGVSLVDNIAVRTKGSFYYQPLGTEIDARRMYEVALDSNNNLYVLAGDGFSGWPLTYNSWKDSFDSRSLIVGGVNKARCTNISETSGFTGVNDRIARRILTFKRDGNAMKQTLAWVLAIGAAATIYLGDCVVAFGIFFMTARETDVANELIFTTLLIGEPIALIIGVPKPKLGGLMLATITLLTAIVALVSYLDGPGPHRALEILWFGAVFWGPKLLISYYLIWKSHLASWRLAA